MIVESEFGKGTEERIIALDKAETFCLTDEIVMEIASIGAAVCVVFPSFPLSPSLPENELLCFLLMDFQSN